jgi:DhnA family fructose-bisphosphate aldolase class Ia
MGIKRRLEALQHPDHTFRFLALDHGLTDGHSPNTPDWNRLEDLNACAPEVTGVVVTPGVARNARLLPRTPLVIQAFGAPRGHTKVPTVSIEEAVRLGAVAISVQIDMRVAQLSEHIEKLAMTTSHSHSVGIPVLFMTSGYNDNSAKEIAHAIRVSYELGADIIKVAASVTAEDAHIEGLVDAVSAAPPVLIAGGPAPRNLAEIITATRDWGFAGYCLGRTVFEDKDPQGHLRRFNELFSANPARDIIDTN